MEPCEDLGKIKEGIIKLIQPLVNEFNKYWGEIGNINFAEINLNELDNKKDEILNKIKGKIYEKEKWNDSKKLTIYYIVDFIIKFYYRAKKIMIEYYREILVNKKNIDEIMKNIIEKKLNQEKRNRLIKDDMRNLNKGLQEFNNATKLLKETDPTLYEKIKKENKKYLTFFGDNAMIFTKNFMEKCMPIYFKIVNQYVFESGLNNLINQLNNFVIEGNMELITLETLQSVKRQYEHLIRKFNGYYSRLTEKYNTALKDFIDKNKNILIEDIFENITKGLMNELEEFINNTFDKIDDRTIKLINNKIESYADLFKATFVAAIKNNGLNVEKIKNIDDFVNDFKQIMENKAKEVIDTMEAIKEQTPQILQGRRGRIYSDASDTSNKKKENRRESVVRFEPENIQKELEQLRRMRQEIKRIEEEEKSNYPDLKLPETLTAEDILFNNTFINYVENLRQKYDDFEIKKEIRNMLKSNGISNNDLIDEIIIRLSIDDED